MSSHFNLVKTEILIDCIKISTLVSFGTFSSFRELITSSQTVLFKCHDSFYFEEN